MKYFEDGINTCTITLGGADRRHPFSSSDEDPDESLNESLYEGLSDEACAQHMARLENSQVQEPGEQESQYEYIYLRRGYRPSDDGAVKVWSGHYKIGKTKYVDVKKRQPDGSNPARSQPIAKWPVQHDRCAGVETMLKERLGYLNINLGKGGKEWFTMRLMMSEDKTALWNNMEMHEDHFIALIDFYTGVRHERLSVEEPTHNRDHAQGQEAKRPRRDSGRATPSQPHPDLLKWIDDVSAAATFTPCIPLNLQDAMFELIQSCKWLKGGSTFAKSSTEKRYALSAVVAMIHLLKWYPTWDGDIRTITVEMKQSLSGTTMQHKKFGRPLESVLSTTGGAAGTMRAAIELIQGHCAWGQQRPLGYTRPLTGQRHYVWHPESLRVYLNEEGTTFTVIYGSANAFGTHRWSTKSEGGSDTAPPCL